MQLHRLSNPVFLKKLASMIIQKYSFLSSENITMLLSFNNLTNHQGLSHLSNQYLGTIKRYNHFKH